MTRLVLGSASSGRLRVLRSAGIDPLVVVSEVDEDALLARLAPDSRPGDVVNALAAAKSDDVVGRLPPEIAADCVVIACDSMLYLDGVLCGKPGSAAAAREQWKAMAGRSGVLYTGHRVTRRQAGAPPRNANGTAATRVFFADPDPDDLTAYLASGEPLGVAGSFTLDGLGGWFIERIEGDPSTVIGLSLPLVRQLLVEVGISIAGLWENNSGS